MPSKRKRRDFVKRSMVTVAGLGMAPTVHKLSSTGAGGGYGAIMGATSPAYSAGVLSHAVGGSRRKRKKTKRKKKVKK